MPTVLIAFGWRLFFYSNEGTEPIHIHAEKGDMECKFWILPKKKDITEAYAFNFTPKAKKEIRRIIFDNFSLILSEWKNHFKTKKP